MHRHSDAERAAYYRQQACACAASALTTAIAEVKQAYLDLQQGWLCLAPKAETGLNDLVDAPRGGDPESEPGQSMSVVRDRQQATGWREDRNCSDA